jgi:NADH-quinone oxidoreductase subunit M
MLEEIVASQQAGYPILTVLTFLPILAAIIVWRLSDNNQIKKIGLGTTALVFLLSLQLYFSFVPGTAAVQFAENVSWIAPLGIQYHLGVDGISVFFVILTALLGFLIMLYSLDEVNQKLRTYVLCILSLEGIVIGIFSALDLVLFFFFWEIMLIPSYFLIKVWGSGQKEYAAFKYIVYNLTSSVLMLVGIAILFLNYHDYAVIHDLYPIYSTDLNRMLAVPLELEKQIWVFILFFFGFAVKTPMVPFHTWLPDALFSGPIAASVVLAGIKLGTYGFLRFSLPLAPEASQMFVPLMMALGLIGILYGGVIALMQSDLKRMMAYSSIGHLGFVVVGLFALNFRGLQGSLIQMLNLGITTAGLFFIIGFLMNRRLPTEIKRLGGLARPLPVLATVTLIVALASIGLPGTNGFIGEFLILLGAFEAYWLYAAIGVIGIILGAAYMLWMYEQAIFGKSALGGDEEKSKGLKDFNLREWVVGTVLVVLIFWVGIYPAPFLNVMNGSIDGLVQRLQQGAVTSTASPQVPDASPNFQTYGENVASTAVETDTALKGEPQF